MAYRLVRSLVYKRGVGIRETVWVGVWFGKTNSVGVDLFLHAEPRRRSELLYGANSHRESSGKHHIDKQHQRGT